MNLAEVVGVFDKLRKVALDNHQDLDKIEVKFETFDERFEENADEYQNPTDITRAFIDTVDWDSVIIRIERYAKFDTDTED